MQGNGNVKKAFLPITSLSNKLGLVALESRVANPDNRGSAHCRIGATRLIHQNDALTGLWCFASALSRLEAVNPVRPGREQRQRWNRVPGCGWCKVPPNNKGACTAPTAQRATQAIRKAPLLSQDCLATVLNLLNNQATVYSRFYCARFRATGY